MNREIHGVVIHGSSLDNETRCAHYHAENDIVAIKFKCCGKWFACHVCHAALVGHAAEVWPRRELAQHAVLCGACGQQLTIHEYLACGSTCPSCRHQFNPGCTRHTHFYFEQSSAP